MAESSMWKAGDFVAPGAGSANAYGLNKRRALEERLGKEWVAREMAAGAQLNPMEPWRRVGFSPEFFGVFQRVG